MCSLCQCFIMCLHTSYKGFTGNPAGNVPLIPRKCNYKDHLSYPFVYPKHNDKSSVNAAQYAPTKAGIRKY